MCQHNVDSPRQVWVTIVTKNELCAMYSHPNVFRMDRSATKNLLSI